MKLRLDEWSDFKIRKEISDTRFFFFRRDGERTQAYAHKPCCASSLALTSSLVNSANIVLGGFKASNYSCFFFIY